MLTIVKATAEIINALDFILMAECRDALLDRGTALQLQASFPLTVLQLPASWHKTPQLPSRCDMVIFARAAALHQHQQALLLRAIVKYHAGIIKSLVSACLVCHSF